MGLLLGPILYARTSDDPNRWRFDVRVLATGDVEPRLIVDLDGGSTERTGLAIARFPGTTRLWTWRVAVPRAAEEQRISYRIVDGAESLAHVGDVAIPAAGTLPRVACFSCAGFAKSSDALKVEDPEALWTSMIYRHTRGLEGDVSPDDPTGFHLLLGIGDQIYADSIPSTSWLQRLPRDQLKRLRASVTFEDRVLREFVELYTRVWSYPAVAHMLARVPGVHTWDDHDIMDGWGSHATEIQEHPRYRSIFSAARVAFSVFQLGGDASGEAPLVVRTGGGEGTDHFLQHLKLREPTRWLDIILLDLRSHRTKRQVLSPAQWRTLSQAMDQYVADAEAAEAAGSAAEHRHVLVVSTIPVVYLRFRFGVFVLENLIPGTQGLEDDLRDQWEHPAHQGDRARLIMKLLELRSRARAQVSIVSGDVHVASRGRVVSSDPRHIRTEPPENRATIAQLTTSPIVNAPPPGWQASLLEKIGTGERSEVAEAVFTELVEIESGRQVLPMRNFLSLGFDRPGGGDQGRMWAEWVMEDGVPRQQLVVTS
jgi:hypothetical protein